MRAISATCLLASLSFVVSSTAWAARPAAEPQVRAHAGLSVVSAPSPIGVTLGVDSRVGQSLALDAGVFFSTPGDLAFTSERATAQEHIRLRHGLYTMPGLRIPHSQPRNFRWDIYVRAGPGVVWTEDIWDRAQDSTRGQMDPAGFAGVDGVIIKKAVGLRLGVRGAFTSVYDSQLQTDVFFWAPQYNAELVYQFGVRGTTK